jgi:trehalose utilization protein
MRITIWNEFRHERDNETVRAIYPEGMHKVWADTLKQRIAGAEIRTATLDEPQHGLTDDVLANTDVLTWWGHAAHGEVNDAIVDKVHQRVLEGMGLVVLHSGHFCKIFKKLMGTSCALRWREMAERERLWCVNPGHPIADGLEDEYFELPQTEMYGELFDIPEPDELIFISWFEGGEVFRSGCCWTRGKGKVFYFRPGHETFPIYYDANVQRVLANGVQYVAPRSSAPVRLDGRNIAEPLSPVDSTHEVDESLHR